MSTNRLSSSQPDFILTVVRRPENFRPRNYFDKPQTGIVVSRSRCASYEEAHDDLVRCNRLSMYQSLDTWAVIETADAESTF